jgi:hypothetical protein
MLLQMESIRQNWIMLQKLWKKEAHAVCENATKITCTKVLHLQNRAWKNVA